MSHSLPCILYISFWIWIWSFHTSSNFHCQNSHIKFFFYQLQQGVSQDRICLTPVDFLWKGLDCFFVCLSTALSFKPFIPCHSLDIAEALRSQRGTKLSDFPTNQSVGQCDSCNQHWCFLSFFFWDSGYLKQSRQPKYILTSLPNRKGKTWA